MEVKWYKNDKLLNTDDPAKLKFVLGICFLKIKRANFENIHFLTVLGFKNCQN